MSPSKLSEKYWKGGDKFGACVSQLFSRGKNEHFEEGVSQIYIGGFFREADTFSTFVSQLYSERKIYDATSVFVALCSSVHMRGFL